MNDRLAQSKKVGKEFYCSRNGECCQAKGIKSTPKKATQNLKTKMFTATEHLSNLLHTAPKNHFSLPN